MQQTSNPVGILIADPSEVKVWLRRPPHQPEVELKPERVQEALQALPGWKLNLNRQSLERLHDFGDARVALAYAAFITQLVGADRQKVSVMVTGGHVGVSLHGYPRKGTRGGITESVLETAKQLG
jgi:pterin-4a-carbinolamine dehydratase